MKVIYTALFGSYEELKEPAVITPGWQYICYTDQDVSVETNWDVIKMVNTDEVSQRLARLVKITQSKWNQSIWVDASFQVNCNLDEFWNKYYKGGITAPKHPARNCVYRESMVCQRRDLDKSNVAKQIDKYARKGLPSHAGLISSGILLRDNSQEVKNFCAMWWEEILNGSIRDQIGFAYCQWKMPEAVNVIDYDYRVRTEFIYSKHYHKR